MLSKTVVRVLMNVAFEINVPKLNVKVQDVEQLGMCKSNRVGTVMMEVSFGINLECIP